MVRLKINKGVYRQFRTSPGAQSLVNAQANRLAAQFGPGYAVNHGSAAGSRYRAYVFPKGALARRKAKQGDLVKKAASSGLAMGGRT